MSTWYLDFTFNGSQNMWFLEFILYILIPEYGQLNSPLISCNINIIELIYNRCYMLMYLMTAPGVYIS